MGYIANLLLFAPIFAVVSAALYFAVYRILKKKREKPGFMKIFAEFVLTGWIVVFIYITQIMGFGSGMGELNINPLHMFFTAFRYGSNNSGMVWQFLLNILMFVPLGFLLPAVFPKKCATWPRVLLVSFCVTLATELLQLLTPRSTDIDDVIANTAGGLCGFACFIILYAVITRIRRRKSDISQLGRKAAISVVILLAITVPFIAVSVSDGRSEFGNFYYGHNQPRNILIEGEISQDETTRAVYQYLPRIDTKDLQQKLIAASGFSGQFSESPGYWELNDGKYRSIDISQYRTWNVQYHRGEDYIPAADATLNSEEAVSLALAYLNEFGVAPDTIQYEAGASRTDEGADFRLEFSSTESRAGQMVSGGITVYLAADGELTSISDGRIWCEYVRDIPCISPRDAILIAHDVGVGDWNGTAYISSVDADYTFLDDTGYLVPTWKINARFLSQSGEEYAWTPIIDAVK